jgi:hypothetical protein
VTTSDLTGTEMIVLLVLMAEGRGLTNTEIKEHGPELKAPNRRKLNTLGLIDSDTSKVPHRHSLADRGWATCNDLLGTTPPAGTTPQGKALFTVLAGLGRHFRRSNLRLADVFLPSEDSVEPDPVTSSSSEQTTADVETRVVDAYRALAAKPGAWIQLTALRSQLRDVGRADLDGVLRALYSRPGFRLIPEENRKSLTADDRAAAVSIGNQDKHLISMEPV